MTSYKALLVICDGMGDRVQREFGDETPLGIAKTPTFDRLASTGSVGLMDPVSPGIRPGSDYATTALLGYNPHVYYVGRGGLEAAGAGMEPKPGDVAFRCNFSTVDENLTVIDRRAGRIEHGTTEIAETVRSIRPKGIKGLRIDFQATVAHRGVLIFRGRGLSRMVSDVDPHETGVKILKCEPLDDSTAAKRTAVAVNDFVLRSFKILKNHPVNLERIREGKRPANIVLPRGAGTLPPFKSLHDLYGMKVACVAAVALVKGVCRIAGAEIITPEGATGGLDTNYEGKARAALRALENHDLVILHVKAPDVASHDGDFRMKASVIEKIDAAVGKIIPSLDMASTYVVVTADHSTPVSVKDHSGNPVPLLINGPGVPKSKVSKFSENAVSRGNLGRLHGLDVMPMIADYLDKARKFGF
jgi:2,3-bisphosphoglycerate-independent phosphoglycerate mutase